MNKHLNGGDVRAALKRLNQAAGRPLIHLDGSVGPMRCNVGHFGCSKEGSALWKFYEVVTPQGAERTIAYCGTPALAVALIDAFREGFERGEEQAYKHATQEAMKLAQYGVLA